MATTDKLTYDSTNKKRSKTVSQSEVSKTYNFNTKGKYNDSDIDLTVNVDLSSLTSATATTDDIASGKTAYVNGTKITGTAQSSSATTITNLDTNFTGIENKYTGTTIASINSFDAVSVPDVNDTEYIFNSSDFSISTKITVDELYPELSITADKILANKTILGMKGTATSDATATASDIASGKTAYVNGTKITGTYSGLSGSSTGTQIAALYKGSTSSLSAMSSLNNQPGYLSLNTLAGKLIKSTDGKIFIYPYQLANSSKTTYGYLYKIVILNLTTASVSMSNYSSKAFPCIVY